eukprot:m.22801 g.22801  ORF g.22801 m.22801 type:complete len:304 (+) comp7441_c0_seq1:325-1236(+)
MDSSDIQNFVANYMDTVNKEVKTEGKEIDLATKMTSRDPTINEQEKPESVHQQVQPETGVQSKADVTQETLDQEGRNPAGQKVETTPDLGKQQIESTESTEGEQKKPPPSEYNAGDYVWFEYKSLPFWPCEVENVFYDKVKDKYEYGLRFFGDETESSTRNTKKLKPFVTKDYAMLKEKGLKKSADSKDAKLFSLALEQCLKAAEKTEEEMLQLAEVIAIREIKEASEKAKENKRRAAEAAAPRKRPKYGPGTPYCYEERAFNSQKYQVAKNLQQYFKEQKLGNKKIQPPLPEEPAPLHLLKP